MTGSPLISRFVSHPRAATAVRAISTVFGTAAELLWPSNCVGCDAALEPGGYLCEVCAAVPRRLKPPFCSVCSRTFADDGTPAAPSGAGVCTDCREQQFAFECAAHFCHHDGLARDLLIRFKYGKEHYLRQPLGGWLVDAMRSDERLRQRPADAIVPVPLHRRRERERGFNQSEALALRVSRTTGVPVWRALWRDPRDRRPRRISLARNARKICEGAFVADPGRPVAGTHLLLVDDVYTTGSTVHACARVLRRSGAESVRVLTVTRR